MKVLHVIQELGVGGAERVTLALVRGGRAAGHDAAIAAADGALAAEAHRPKAARAVGVVMNRNPLPIVLPCHRVVGANGSLVGYAGGLERKELLLELEGAIQPKLDV